MARTGYPLIQILDQLRLAKEELTIPVGTFPYIDRHNKGVYLLEFAYKNLKSFIEEQDEAPF